MERLKQTIKKRIEKLGIKVVYRPLDCQGRAFIPQKIIVLDPELTAFEMEQIILHEFGHIIEGHYFSPLNSPHARIKKEGEAERFRIKENLKSYTKHTPKKYWNTQHFSKYYNVEPTFEYFVSEELKKYQ